MTEKTRNDYILELVKLPEEARAKAQTPAYVETTRGFACWGFRDRGGVPIRIQKSSHVADSLEDEGIWVFSEDGSALLTVEQVRKLLPILQTFADTGELPVPEGEQRQ